MKCVLFLFLTVGMAYAATVQELQPLRVGPVSYYGALGTSGNKVIGQKNSKSAQVRGMSLFWGDNTGSYYYTNDAITWLVDNFKAEVVRAPVSVKCYKATSCSSVSNGLIDVGYLTTPLIQKNQIDSAVRAAVLNDIYVIIDWHTHLGLNSEEQTAAVAFFTEMATLYKDVPNVIFEIYNEPVNDSWANLVTYGNKVAAAIRGTGNNNLILMGTPSYSADLSGPASSGLSATHVAYVFHFYSASHPLSSNQSKLEGVLNAGRALFISEWGTTDYSGVTYSNFSPSQTWLDWLDTKGISHVNWSVRHSTVDNVFEGSAIFNSSTALYNKQLLNASTLTASGTAIKNYMVGKYRSWADSTNPSSNAGSLSLPSVFHDTTVYMGAADLAILTNTSLTYTSSNTAVAAITGGKVKIVGPGYTLIKASNGSANKTIAVVVRALSDQTWAAKNILCYINNKCTNTLTITNGIYTLPTSAATTGQGMAVTLTSSDNTIAQGGTNNTITVKKLGVVTMTATANALLGYRALDTSFTFTYRKLQQVISLKSQTVDLSDGGSLELFTQETVTTSGLPITYEVASDVEGMNARREGTMLLFENAGIITVTATVPEDDTYGALEVVATITVTDKNGISAIAYAPKHSFQLQTMANGISMYAPKAGTYHYAVVDMKGAVIANRTLSLTEGHYSVDLSNIPSGLYAVKVRGGSIGESITFFKQEMR